MNTRFFFATPLLLTVVTVLLASSMCSTASASITSTKDSADFNTLSWEGNAAPNLAYGIDLNDWSFGGGNYTVVQDAVVGATGGVGAFSAANGWTIEWRMKMDLNDLPTAAVFVNDVLQGSTRGSMTFQLGDGQDTTARWTEVTMGQTDATEWVIWDALNGGLMWRGGDITAMTTVRVAAEATGGDDQYKMYVDGVEVLDIVATAGAFNRQWFGDLGAAVSGGTAIIDYIRYDTSGAFAPIPEPATIALLAIGLALVPFGRRAPR